jgi:tetratricopeptide (TPR) repeat protein
MKSRVISIVFSLLAPIALQAQFQNAPETGTPLSGARSQIATERVSIMGKVITQDGSAPAGHGEVILKCGSTERARTSIDSHGGYSMMVAVAPDDATVGLAEREPGTSAIQNWSDCEIAAQVSGYTSPSVHLFGNHDHVVQVSPIIVHPNSVAEGFSVSVASLQAPEKAKKDFEKGEQQAKKGRWAAASDYFRRAVQAYPRYALAWLELGRTQAQQNSFMEAQQSFHQAVSQDSHLLDGYVELARIALQQSAWKELADATDHLVEAYPNAFPQYWFLNGAAKYNLGDRAAAGVSAERGLRLDSKHSIPQLEYLYAMTLAAKHDYKAAAEHLGEYLRLAPHSADSQAAQAKLAELEKAMKPVAAETSGEVDFSLPK